MLAMCAGCYLAGCTEEKKSNFNSFDLVMDYLVIQEEKSHYNVLYE